MSELFYMALAIIRIAQSVLDEIYRICITETLNFFGLRMY